MSDTSRVAIVMSRMPRLIAPEADWLRGLRACLRRLCDRRQMLLINLGTAGSDFVLRGAERIGVETQSVDGAEADVRDRPLIQQADELLVLSVRPRGNIHQLLVERLQRGDGHIILVDLPDLQPQAVRQELLDLGATLWAPDSEWLRPFGERRDEGDLSVAADSILSLSALPSDDLVPYLTHTTRACPGPWPRQTQDDYLDSLLDASPTADHSALHTLRRIVTERRLIGSGRTIRGGYPIVSFTAAPIRVLPSLRCFQTHRARWDFEPFAISIRRDVLEQRGVRPAVYGGESLWTGLADFQRPFFQLSGERSATGTGGTPRHDWLTEREWRHLGDLDLSAMTPEELVVLVPTVEAARWLQPYCPWPLTLWPGEV
ncbi:MAG: hypothetical protein JWN70_4071 [Planctomycetaceae bacterium]|nr:hypothetical protein [Planctomycetaceae bacterium]